MNAIKTWVAEATVIKREFVICRAEAGELTWQSAAGLLGMSPRQLRRVRKRYREHGQAGLRDGRKASGRRRQIAPEERQKVIRLKKERYFDFSVRHFYEFATEHHSLRASYSWTLKTLQQEGLVRKQRKRGTYRRRRPRRPMRGMLLHLDGSTHPWLGPGRPEWDLILAADDADSRLLFGRFVPEEGTLSTMEALWHVVTEHGCFETLYSDRGSHFLPKDPHHDGQVQRALKQLGIGHIGAHSPQARGRGERIFGTVQDRLIPELRLAGITDYDAANRYLQQVFMPDFNRRFTVQPCCPQVTYCAPPPVDLHLVLSVQKTRQVRNDYTVHFKRLKLQLPNSKARPLPKAKVTVHTFIDQTLGISYQGRLLACYRPDGRPVALPAKPSPLACLPTQPRPTKPDINRRKPDSSDPDFWSFLMSENEQSPVVSRNDLYHHDWSNPDIY